MPEHLEDRLVAISPVIVVALFVGLAVLELALASRERTSPPLGRFGTNFALMLLTAGLSILTPLSSVIAADWAERQDIGLFNWVAAPAVLVLLATFLLRGMTLYWLHRLSHAVPLLWRLHRVHHSDRFFDLSVSVRQHPLEYLVRAPLFMLLTVAAGLPVWAVVIVDLGLVASQYWEHLDVPVSERWRRRLGWLLMTPDLHRMHHSANPLQTESNYGSFLVLWDRLFGTYRSCEPIARIGLGDEDDQWADGLAGQLLLPLQPPRRRAAA
jgi:sterol desaturase/sphingolipid hydroxylase (fatty acid hydroxylase superfamily)